MSHKLFKKKKKQFQKKIKKKKNIFDNDDIK